MEEFDLHFWVEQAEEQRIKRFRAAVHTVLVAIAGSETLKKRMIMKGGMLLAIRYHSKRFTRDIDFSTSTKRSAFDEEFFLEQLERALAVAVEKLDYGLDCRVQSYEFKPPAANATFPTFKVRIGYAEKINHKTHKRLLQGGASEVVEIDYSLNESTLDVESILFPSGETVLAYSLSDLIAEKYRAALQQEARGRFRRQDIYDLHFLIKNCPVHTKSQREKILGCLLTKAEARGLKIDATSISQRKIVERSKKDYHTLEAEIEDDLPEFGQVYSLVRSYYENLPWKQAYPHEQAGKEGRG
jgi:predicted nucleotidyltransferase component of viral defense system